MEENSNKSAFIIVYGACALSGALVGLFAGWLIWGLP